MGALKEFRQFLLRGSVVDLAIGVVIGAAFGAMVTAFVQDLLTPLIAAVARQPDFSALTFTVKNSVFRYGHFINVVISFVIIGGVIFFFVVKPINTLIAHSRHEPPPDPTTKRCPECLSTIPLQARRCAFCTSQVSSP